MKLSLFLLPTISLILLSRAGIAQGQENRVEVYQTRTHCGGLEDCSQSKEVPDCKLTLEYQNSALKWIEVYGLGENNSGMKGYFSLSNTEEPYSTPSGPQVQLNEVKVQGDRIDALLRASALRWGVYSEIVEFKVKGFTPESVRSVFANFQVRLARIPGVWIKINCENLTRIKL